MPDKLKKFGDVRSFPETCLDGAQALTSEGFSIEGDNAGYLLGYYPAVKNNPFQQMLYAEGMKHGFACFPLNHVDDLSRTPNGLKLVLHLHWVHRAFSMLETKAQAKAAMWRFISEIKHAQNAGHKIVWTVHNKLSHNSLFRSEEYILRSALAEQADVIHIMNPDSADICAPEYNLPPEKLLSVEHPSYCGVYGDYVSKEAARLQLGLAPDEKVFLLFGRLMPQKGARQFLAELDHLQGMFANKVRVLLVGRESSPDFTEEIIALTAGRADVKSVRDYVGDQDVQVYFRAADVVVCPYTAGLNSGVVMTAASFGKPVVTSDRFKSVFKGIEECMVCFDTSDMSCVVKACTQAYMLAQHPDVEAKITAWAQERQPYKISSQFFTALRNVL